MPKTQTFTTNINCMGCVGAVTPYIENLKGVISWKVDIEKPDKLLEVETENVTESQIIHAVHEAGYKIEPVKKSL